MLMNKEEYEKEICSWGVKIFTTQNLVEHV